MKQIKYLGIFFVTISSILNYVANGIPDTSNKIAVGLLSTFLGILGCYAWISFKGQPKWNCLWGLVMPLGIIPVLLLKNKYVTSDKE
jgi:hypothetical protein